MLSYDTLRDSDASGVSSGGRGGGADKHCVAARFQHLADVVQQATEAVVPFEHHDREPMASVRTVWALHD